MRRIDLRIPDEWLGADDLVGHLLDGRTVPVRHVLAGAERINVYRPDGSLLAAFWPGAIPRPIWIAAAPFWMQAASQETRNRGVAFGGARREYVRADGTRSRTSQIDPRRFPDIKAVGSGVLGAFDRSVRYPYGRLTEFTMRHPAVTHGVLAYLQVLARRYQEAVPDRYAAQERYARATRPEWLFPGTPFSTCTVNRNFPTAVHVDDGDLACGFGVLSVLRGGLYSGCETVLPRWGVAADLRSGDALFYDVHEPHGNQPLAGLPGRYQRIAIVSYLRQMIPCCGSAEEERKRAQRRRLGDPLYTPEEIARLEEIAAS